jgi:hypothetical protein
MISMHLKPLQPLLPGGLHVKFPVPRPLPRPYELTEVSIVLSKHMGHDDVPVIPPSKHVRESRATNTLFPKPVPIIAGQRRVPTRAARASATMLAKNYSVKNYKCNSIHRSLNLLKSLLL